MARIVGAANDHRRSFVSVDLGAITGNVRALRRMLPGNCLFGAVVKADGYGHGAVEVAHAALAGGAAWLLVATVPEGLALRNAGLNSTPILILGPVSADEVDDVVRATLIPTVDDSSPLHGIAAAAERQGRAPYPVHVKVDTGLNRFGVAAPEAVAFVHSLSNAHAITVAGLSTHFATADHRADAFLQTQAERFEGVVAELQRRGHRPAIVHAANSGAMLQGVGYWDMVRVGIALYGIPPAPDFPLPAGVRPALSVHSRIARVFALSAGDTVGYGQTFRAAAPGHAALVPIGYADGLPRSASNRGYLLVGGYRCRIIGMISMDQCVLALPDDLDAAVDDPVVVIGGQGSAEQTLTTLADASGTIAYELAVRFGARMRRDYRGVVESSQN